jgi:hypothetical protein
MSSDKRVEREDGNTRAALAGASPLANVHVTLPEGESART